MKIERMAYPFPWSDGMFRDCLRNGYHCQVLEKQSYLLGYGIISVGAGESQLLNLCIEKDHRNLGLGRQLLIGLIDIAKDHCADSMFLEVRPSNHKARQLYRDVGFNEVGIRKKYYPDTNGPEDALILGLALKPQVRG